MKSYVGGPSLLSSHPTAQPMSLHASSGACKDEAEAITLHLWLPTQLLRGSALPFFLYTSTWEAVGLFRIATDVILQPEATSAYRLHLPVCFFQYS